MDTTDKITLGTLISTSVIGLGGGAFAGFCDAHNIDPTVLSLRTKNCAFYLPTYIGMIKGAIVGVIANEECGGGHGVVLDGVEWLVTGFGITAGYAILGAVSTGVGYGLGYLAGHLTR